MSIHCVPPGPRFIEFTREEIEKSVPERFEKQVAQYPDHLAVKTKLHRLTYNEFNRFANRIARAITQRSGDNEAVALLLGHDSSAIVSIFGVLKAGRCFVPLDPLLPPSRLNYMLGDSRAKIVVTNNQFLALAQRLLGCSPTIINIDQLDLSMKADNLGLSISPDNMSCILYTSGTTGRPKGVMHSHRNELHNVMHHTNSLCLSPDDRLTLLGSYSTGQGMQDLYCALLNGATLYPWSLKSDGLTGIADWLIGEGMTVYHSAATVFRHFVRNLSGEEEFPQLRILRLGSEQVSWKDLESFRKHFSRDCVFVNALSSSETKTIRQYVLGKDSQIAGIVPVGYPVDDMGVFILDESGNELGFNHVGEIAVRSRYLSSGYWQKPDLTATAYGSDPGCPENRIFRTGEWGRMSPDDCLEHLGRRDAQVKIRGYRVETYETELALLRHPAVDQVLVLCREDRRGDKSLVAYTIVNQVFQPTVTELRRFLEERIPVYMVPSAFVFLDSLPLTPNGKVDHAALPEPGRARPDLGVAFVASRNPTEESLARVWSEILDINEVGVDDNFFDLGGNSILAMQVVARLEKMFHVGLPLERFFESPTVGLLSREMSLVAHEKLETPAIEPVRRNENFPLSSFQQRLWFLDQWEPGNPFYTICRAYRISKRLDLKLMEDSLNAVVARHEILRTTFRDAENRPMQVIAPFLNLRLDFVDLKGLTEDNRKIQSTRLVNEEARRTFDMSQGPLLRATVIRLDEDEHIFIITVHQIVCDGWSMQILLRELWTFYEAFSLKRMPFLASLERQYADFTVWQRQLLCEDLLRPQIAYWKNQLRGRLPVLNLPTDHPRSAQQSFRGGRISFVLSEALTQALNDLSHRQGVTLFMTMMTAFTGLLYRYTGQEDLTVGFPIANRNWDGNTGLIGFFVNTLVLRADSSGNPIFKELLARVRDSCLGAYANQDLPFERLVEELRPERDLTHNPTFQTLFTFQNTQVANLPLQKLEWEPIDVDSGTSKFDLMLSLAERDKKLVGFFEYSSDLFNRLTIERMIGHFQALIQGVVADPDQPVSTVSLLTETERYQLLVEWNDTEAEYPSDVCIHELFEAQVERTPDAVAVELEGKQFSYRELNARSNQLAYRLRELGVGPEGLVGICVERSFEMMVGLLGILKAGGTYVPLDPTYPKERLAFMFEDAKISVLVTHTRVISNLPHNSLLTVFLDDLSVLDRGDDRNPNSGAKADRLAYVIYTSGSTGAPKGVCGLHRGAVNRFAWMWKFYPFRWNEKSCVKTSLTFVDSVWEVFGPLLQGVPLVLIPDDVLRDPERLVGSLRDRRVTRIGLVPSLLKTLLDSVPVLQDHVPELKLWCCSGEILPKDVVERFRKSMPDATLLNLYGSTEVSADVTCCDTRTANSNRVIPIGRPLSNTQIYILDSNLQPVPTGVPGELYVGGDGVAAGYLNRAELTAEKFVANPFSAKSGSRLYRTGDRARYLPDGNIEFLGRFDNQVKIRGYRIELGEIEAALNQHPGVKETVVVLRERDSSGDKDLVAYFVRKQDSSPSVIDLRGFLRQKVPEYMMPAFFISIDALPLSPNGKVDRSKLSPPDDSRPNLDEVFVEPRTEIEELVAQVWKEVLKLEKIGVHDDFFELGGHSLLATQVVSRLRKILDIDLPLRKLFELPNIAELASFIDTLLRDQSSAKVPPIIPVSRDHVLPLSFSQQRLWFLHELDPTMTAYNISAVFRVEGPLNIIVLEKALNEIVARHEILRTTFPILEGSPVQNILPNLRLRVNIVDLGNLPEKARESRPREVTLEEARQAFDLPNGPLLRAKILRFSHRVHFLLLNVDHAVLDGWSISILFKELATLYEAFAESDVSPFSPLSIQYADYSVWQREFLQGEVLESQLAYWRQQLGDNLPALNLPTDFPRPSMLTFKGARKSFPLSNQLTEALKTLSRREGVTLFMTLLAAFQILLRRYTEQEDIVVGSTVAGRNRPEIEGLIGFFINVLVLRTDLSGNPTFAELLKRIREVCLDAYAHQDVPFEKIVESIAPDRDLSRNPLFQVMFNMVDISEHVLQLSGCEVIRESFVEPEAKFDITLYAPDKSGAIELAIVYNTDLFSERRIVAMLEQFHYLLCQIAQRPEERIAAYSLVPLSSRTFLPDPTEALDDTWHGAIHTLFSKQAERQPDRLAVVDPKETWDYRELDRHSNQLANCLISSGIQPKDVVAIYSHRSCPLVLALLGVVKAGAAFVILDPAYPASRLIDYLEICRPKGWIQMDAAGNLPEAVASLVAGLEISPRVSLGSTKQGIADFLKQYPERDTGVSIDADDPAYVAFTSGSTGQPKGVLCRHGPITHFLPWQEEEFDLRSTDRLSLLSGLAYNHLHRDVFTALALGATVYVPASEILKSPDLLTQWLEENAITVLHLTPALGRLLLTPRDKTLPSVRRIFFGGDVLTSEDVTLTRELAPKAKIVSFYGATETQRAVGYYEIPEETSTSNDAATHPVPLGRGIKDVQLLLLNKNAQLAGIGELGELYMRSPHLASGYLGDEKLTREMFVTNPFTNDPNDRLHRTGELARYLPDGNVEWAGRNDRRVNIRGFRVELAEVESVLGQHPAVKDSAVVSKEFLLEGSSPISTNDLRLVAYVVPELDQPLSIDELRSFLSAKLPDYMVPSHFLILGRLPLSPNGKVNYEALPAAEQSRTGPTEWFVAPRNDLEANLCKIFSQVLGIEQIGVNDNFFALGGHSLLAAQAAARVKEVFGVALKLRAFLESPTVAALAKQVELIFSTGQTTAQSAKDEREEIEI